jgi:F-type H+-transporting ATPase subunit epsilon
MSKTFQLDIVTPQGKVFSEAVESLRAPGVEGSFGVLPGHTPFMTTLQVGVVELTQDGRTRRLAISGGFIEVMPDHTAILAQTAEFAESIDVERAQDARRRAEERLKVHQADLDEARARSALERALNRLRIAGKEPVRV